MSNLSLAESSSFSLLSHGPSGAEWTAAHDALKASDALWRALAFDGVQHDGKGGLVENRRCPSCGSTLSRAISAELAREVCCHQAAVHALSEAAIADAGKAKPKARRGFSAMAPERQRELAKIGGQTAHRAGVAHRFTPEEARIAGKRGGQVVGADAQHMSEIGRRGGIARSAKLRLQSE